MPAIEAAVIGGAARLLSKPITDLYDAAKKQFKDIGAKWKRLDEIDHIHDKLSSVSLVRTITSSTPIPLAKFYHPPKLKIPKADKPKQIDSLDGISTSQNVLITGTAGQGKSIFMRYLCSKELEAGKFIPLFIELKELDEKNSLLDLIIGNMTCLGIREVDKTLLTFFLDSGQFIFFLDGFDEIKREHVQQAQTSLKTLSATYPKTRWVVSSRTGSLGEHLSGIPRLLHTQLVPLVIEDFEPFYCALGIDERCRANLLEAIKRSPTRIQNVLTTPLMLTLLNLTFGAARHIPLTLHEFYENMFHVLVSRHDDTKGYFFRQKATSLTNADLQAAFSAFCFLSKDYSVSLTDDQFATCAKGAARLTNLSFTVEGLKADLIDSVCLMVRDGLKTAFLHKSIQEFFAAFFIKSLGEQDKVAKIYQLLRERKWSSWSQELMFLEQIDTYRYIEHYQIPAVESFLSRVAYDPGARVRITKTKFETVLKDSGVYRIYISGTLDPHAFVVNTDLPLAGAMLNEYLQFTVKGAYTFHANKNNVDELDSPTGPIRAVHIETYLKSNAKDKEMFLTKLRDFCDRLGRTRTRLRKTLSDREKSFNEVIGL